MLTIEKAAAIVDCLSLEAMERGSYFRFPFESSSWQTRENHQTQLRQAKHSHCYTSNKGLLTMDDAE